ncbi:MAG: L,D-transpeptidase family protein [Gammaproteobacteria bacterium SHHR-1]|uniref:L,D-transpeptidase family protein n=1 Tax=Magnetovirga frankeli TaxID=947516 RepID=UPI0012930D51|nr:L,D-transpeptidase family protein [gamma proteobacterium SS-5]
MYPTHRDLPKLGLAGLLLLLLLPPAAQASAFRATLERLLPDDGQPIAKLADGETLYGKVFILRMYAANGFKHLWTPAAIRSLDQALLGLADDGLEPSDYRFAEILPFLQSPSRNRYSLEETARIDILLTEAYLRALYHLYYGKADPQGVDPDNNFGQARDGKDRSALLLAWVRKGRIDQAYDWARPDNRRYRQLKQGLQRYRAIAADGGWPQLAKGDSLRPGDRDGRIPAIRRRLAISGDLASGQGDERYDPTLLDGVKAFQQRHGLEVDGIIGPATLAAMNAPVAERIQQIRVNLERQRWILHEDKGEFLAVDIAGFMIYWFREGQVIWREQVQVGKRFTNTPAFKDQVEYIDFNPTWTIPPGILRRSILPELKKDPGYLDKKGYQLLSQKGARLDPHAIDWKGMSHFPYLVRQPPGPDNALGVVKFMFPNKHHVFVHDTNHREYFARQVRTTSSGCIRLRNPLDLAERLLAGQGWTRARIQQVIASGKTTRVNLKQPMRILIVYSTAFADANRVHFKQDIYNRDPRVLSALQGPFRFHQRDLKSGALVKPASMGDSEIGSDALEIEQEPARPSAGFGSPGFLE